MQPQLTCTWTCVVISSYNQLLLEKMLGRTSASTEVGLSAPSSTVAMRVDAGPPRGRGTPPKLAAVPRSGPPHLPGPTASTRAVIPG